MYCDYSTQKRAMYIIHGKTHPNKRLKCPCCPAYLTIPKFNTHFETLHVIPQIAANSSNDDVISKCSNCEMFHFRKNHKK